MTYASARTVAPVARRTFQQHSETFGFDTGKPWALDAFRLLFCMPRAYQPLVDAWDERHPGVRRALDRLVSSGFVEYQEAVVIDTRTGEPADACGAPLDRYCLTASGRRLMRAAKEDLRTLEDAFPRLTRSAAPRLLTMLEVLNIETPHSKLGVSAPTAGFESGMPERSARWWVRRLLELGYVRQLDVKVADVREVIPAHWRVTRMLCRQLDSVIDAFPQYAPPTLRIELRLQRSRFLGPIDPARVGVTGATDYDHDVNCQKILAALVTSPRCSKTGVFSVEPRLNLPTNQTVRPWRFEQTGTGSVFYQPDAEMRERTPGEAGVRRSVVEYERFQTRRDAWSHIERFLGWLHTMTMPFESAVLRFVVDSEPRVRSYVELIEAFADYCLDHPERLPRNHVMLAVTSMERIASFGDHVDPLDDRAWTRIELPVSEEAVRHPVLHDPEHSPYNDYFGGAK